jgi:hypothetical protein
MNCKLFAILIFIITYNFGFSQKANNDTLYVSIFIPNKINIADNCKKDFTDLDSRITKFRNLEKEDKIKEQNKHKADYENLPLNHKKMNQNDLDFYDNQNAENFISQIMREYVAYRLFRPFKIKDRLILVYDKKINAEQYSELMKKGTNSYIINFPQMEIYKNNGELKVKTIVELYSVKENKVVLSEENIGEQKSGLTDYPIICNGIDCAIINSVYPTIMKAVWYMGEKKNE